MGITVSFGNRGSKELDDAFGTRKTVKILSSPSKRAKTKAQGTQGRVDFAPQSTDSQEREDMIAAWSPTKSPLVLSTMGTGHRIRRLETELGTE